MKLFISQPMRGKTDEEIVRERKAAIEAAKEIIGDDVIVLDTFFCDMDLGSPLEYLAESIRQLAKADVAYFAPGWRKARGCQIEHECAVQYGIETIEWKE